MATTAPTKPKIQAEHSGLLNFQVKHQISPDQRTRLVIRVYGGPVALLQAVLFDVNDKPRNSVGFEDLHKAQNTGIKGVTQWNFLTDECKGGYVKWRITVIASAANLGAYEVVEEIWQNDKMIVQTSLRGTIEEGELVDTFIDGVKIS